MGLIQAEGMAVAFVPMKNIYDELGEGVSLLPNVEIPLLGSVIPRAFVVLFQQLSEVLRIHVVIYARFLSLRQLLSEEKVYMPNQNAISQMKQ